MNKFDKDLFYDKIIRGSLRAAMAYLEQFPEEEALCQKYAALYQQEQYLTYDVDARLNRILLIYQKYYRDAFYLALPAEEAAQLLRERLARQFDASSDCSLDELEELVQTAFHQKSLYALTGRTSGYYGPYIWRSEELLHYEVELPEGTQDYAVKMLDDFLMRSWMDYLSFGAIGAGGWSNGDGLIHCVKSCYDLESESFRVSLLKHEAQHAMDQTRYKEITNEELEVRAKLVELIYSEERPMLERFLRQADTSNADNGHAMAAERIIRGFEAYLKKERGTFAGLPIETVQHISRLLFEENSREMAAKYLR